MENNIKIFVACHKPTQVLQNPLLIPIQVGSALAEAHLPGMLHDDTGDNISEKNRSYCEITAQYWAWKNEDADYFGFFHYRRYLSFRDVYPVDREGKLKAAKKVCPYYEVDSINEDLSQYGLNEVDMERVISGYDLITVLRERIDTTVYRQYCQFHPKGELDRVIEILGEKYPSYRLAASEYLDSKEIYYLNMYIMKQSLFEVYLSWLMDILESFESEYNQSAKCKNKDRLMGYLSERLFGIFYTYQRDVGAVCGEVPYIKFYDTTLAEEEDGAKLSKDIRSFQLKPTVFKIHIDMRKFNKMFPAGSKRRILLRSIFRH